MRNLPWATAATALALAVAVAPSASAESEARDPVTSPDVAALVRALECDGPVYQTSRSLMSDGRAGTPRAALAAFARGPGRPLPVHGYDTAGEATKKVVFVYRHAERVRAAVQVENLPGSASWERRAGPWVLTTFASCDPAEFSPDADDEIGIGIVRTADGTRVRAAALQFEPALQHCWPGASMLVSGRALPSYVRDPEQTYGEELVVPYEANATLPATATDSGLRTGSYELWNDVDLRAIYAVTDQRTERWPALTPKPRGCD